MGKILQIGEELDGGRLKVVGQLESAGQYAEIYRVHKTRAPIECLLKVNLPHDMLEKDAIAESTYEFSKEDHIERSIIEAKMICSFYHENIIKLDDLIDIHDGKYKGLLFRNMDNFRHIQRLHVEDMCYHDFDVSMKGSDVQHGVRTLRARINAEDHYIFGKKKFFINLAHGVFEALTALQFTRYARKNLHKEEINYQFFGKPDDAGSRTMIIFYPYVIHRDIRPENIVVEENGTPYLIDFGMACRVNQHDGGLGSKRYSPPEAHLGRYDNDSDAWQIGLCLYEFLSGKHLIDDSPTPSGDKIKQKIQSLNDLSACVKFYDELIDKFENLRKRYLNKASCDREFMACLTVAAYFCQPLHLLPALGDSKFHPSERKFLFLNSFNFDEKIKRYQPSVELRKNQKELMRMKR